ncbi:MAG TPA: lytic transglycosylase domain-containing protein, partial [Sphingomicrobium sp.]|nr:lytic transglycosylase domain-containing protein [Sphingomicrobium sp.]
MRSIAYLLPLVIGSAALAQLAQNRPATPVTSSAAASAVTDINYALADWRRLRTSQGYRFADYARFLIANPDWPEETKLRRWAEKAMVPGENPVTVISFFRSEAPKTGNGFARLAEAYLATGKSTEAAAAARDAWASPDLSIDDQNRIGARFWSSLTSADHDRRVDALLFDKKPSDAQRAVGYASPARRAAFAARIAMQTSAANADQLYRAVESQVPTDAGLLMDRLRFLKDTYRNVSGARWLAARPHNFTHRPADPQRFYEMLLILARDAWANRNYQQAYDIARQVDDSLPAGADVSLQPYGVRDDYTSLTWTAGEAAMSGLNRYADAARQFYKYANGGRSLQVTSKGYYWAGRALAYANRVAEANAYFAQAAAYPELFYGQLALERLGRQVPAPGGLPAMLATDAQRSAFHQKRLVRATQLLGQQGRRDEQALFVRALAESLDSEVERVLAVDFSQQIGRPDLAVWTARAARNNGTAFYVKPAFPTHHGRVAGGRMWSMMHGITRQESSFDRSAVSYAGARGMMQLMPGTAREQAGKMGIGYSYSRLTSDPAYNVSLGSAYYARLLDNWGGNHVLAVASYNAGAGNVRKWVRAYGDPRQPGTDVIRWIERIPFTETRGYVQRVLENSVVYDKLNPQVAASSPMHLST